MGKARTARAAVAAAAVALLVGSLSSCSSGSTQGSGTTTSVRRPAGTIVLDTSGTADAGRCDPLDPRACLLPFPSDRFTVADPSTPTGRRVAFAPESMPANADGVRIDPADWNRADGFSPGSVLLTQVPGIDLDATGAAPLTDMGRSLAPDAPIVLVDATTGQRHPYWAELDANAKADADRLLLVTPAVQLTAGHRYVVGLRNLKGADGSVLSANEVFRAYRDDLTSNIPAIEDRRPAMDRTLDDLEKAGVPRNDLYLAWDFTVASRDSLTDRMVHIRDDAFSSLGGNDDDGAPAFTVDQVEENTSDEIARRISGTYEVPLYLTGAGEPGSKFALGSDGLPTRNAQTPTFEADYTCTIPKVALGDGTTPVPGRGVVYGHGLLGSNREVNASNIRTMSATYGTVYCATNWIGMADEDVANAAGILGDMGRFPTLADRVQQGILNTLMLGRLLRSDKGFVTNAAFQLGGKPLVATGDVFYDGNSQGGIIGGAATAVSTEWTRAVLGVPGMNYSILLNRSKDFEPFLPIFHGAYPNQLDQILVLGLVQMLWDRAEASGYAQFMTDAPPPGTPKHQVLMHVAYGDHQVSTYAAAIEARTIGARLHTPALADGRPGAEWWNLPSLAEGDGAGSAVIVWDSGAAPPPLSNTPPSEGRDSHEDPRRSPDAQRQKSEFLRRDGRITDVCGSAPCTASPAG